MPLNPIPFHSSTLIEGFGHRSALAREVIPRIFRALGKNNDRYAAWMSSFTSSSPVPVSSIAKHYQLEPDAPRLIFALQTYYAVVIKLLAAHFLGGSQPTNQIISGEFFPHRGVLNFTDGSIYDWVDADLSEIIERASRFTFDDIPPDALKALYHDLFPRVLRHALGEYYTPDWLAEYVLDGLGYTGQERLLDPSCGSGTFLTHALRRMPTPDLEQIAGIDIHPLACLAARANLLFHCGRPQKDTILPIYCADTILDPPEIGRFDLIAGNPPWVNWETLPQTYREETKQRWIDYGLFPHTGMDAILGKGKKDLSLLLTYASMDVYLEANGKLGFIITQAVLKSGGAGAGFRQFMISDMPIRIVEVDDLSQIRAFPGASTRAAILIMEKGQAPRYPVPYRLWKKTGKAIKEDDSLETVLGKVKRSELSAEPVAAPDSAWLSGYPAAQSGVRKLLGESDYDAHAGVYTGGANAVYWLDVIGQDGDLLRVRNIVDGAKRPVPQVEARIEPDWVFPLLRGRDVRQWQAEPSAHILVVQDPKQRRGYDEAWLAEHFPATYQYLLQFESILRQRAAFRRYFKAGHPFYSMFDVGAYTFRPVKVVWQGFGAKSMQAVVITEQGGKAIMTNQAMHPFVGLDSEEEAHYLAACLNSDPFEYAVLSHTQAGGKSFAQPGLLKTLRIPKFETTNIVHQTLVTLSWQAHAGSPDQEALAQAAAELWRISPRELAAIRGSLQDWQ